MNNKDEILSKGEWLSLRRNEEGYEYSHDEVGSGTGVALLVFNSNNKQIVKRYEKTSCHHTNELKLTSITGMIEKDEHVLTTVWKELKEEVGISKNPMFNTIWLGITHPSKSSDYQIYMYAIDVGNTKIGKIKGDGTEGEKGSYCKWGFANDFIESDDALNSCMILRLYQLTGIKLF